MSQDTEEKYSAAETRKRFEAALRGARIAGSQHKKGATPKKSKPRRKPRLKRKF